MAAPRLTEEYSGKEAVYDPLQQSYGLEVDARGIERVEAQRVPAPQRGHAFWTRRRLLITTAVTICVIGAVTGAAVGSTVRTRHGESPEPSTSSTAPPSNATMTGAASPQLALLRYPTPISTFGQGTIDVYLQGNDGRVFTKQFINGSWQPSAAEFWTLGGLATSNIAAISRSLGLTDLFVRGNNFDIYNQSRNGTESFSWSQSCLCWDGTNGSASSGPEAAFSTREEVDLFLYGGDGILYDLSWREAPSSSVLSPGEWSWLGAYDGQTHDWFNYTPTVISWGAGRYDFFGVRSFDRALYHRALNDPHGWDPDFESLGGYCTSRPAAVSVTSGQLDVFVRGGDARLWHTSYDSTDPQGWRKFAPLGNVTVLGEPHAVTWLRDGIAVFVCSETDNAIWHARSNGESWTEWSSLGGDFGGPPKAISKAPGQLDVFVVGQRGELMWRNWDEERGNWEPPNEWANLGTP